MTTTRTNSRGERGWASKLLVAMMTAIGGCKTVVAEVRINATPATVWRVLTTAEAYPEWNPVHVKVEGTYAPGARMRVHLREPSGKINVVDSTVRALEPQRRLNQGGGIPGVLTFDHTFILEPDGAGTKVTQQEVFRGVGVAVSDMDWIDAAYERVNAALKARAEALERETPSGPVVSRPADTPQ